MAELTPKEEQIARVAKITRLANNFQECVVDCEADVGMAVEAALMVIKGAARQCPTIEMRCGLLDYMNTYIQSIVAMNHENHPAQQAPDATNPPTLQ